ncbi:hypothetical protein ASE63_19830 [Bosea sp. Root381]|uniref:hypothetical protein n=1 Tax=Bosea sp. Root381 TaxID=1736524 RepID=UPI0006F48D33|nr:hypothetical protein [Bosea sp. Root381]KRE11980.1 hypothetical protein ASE63_19830 [Bosea sp. Root381]
MRRRLGPVFLLATGLAGCNGMAGLGFASAQPDSPEWCEAARASVAAGGSGSQLFAIGRCHEIGVAGFPRDEKLYLSYYAESARWGAPQAAEALARLGRPVPANDLEAAAQDRAAARRRADALAAGASSPSPPGPPRDNPLPASSSIRSPLIGVPSFSFPTLGTTGP